ncbi:hypothetical protein ASPACDRAFT_48450 [Aspergillus aculeatus ATCC 16872]|uniref:Rhodopsin domain-containing protein n=1 Tax=Aspergillus aculeatus (strain ATCC 16872 / CBS 172.66 / WB 5094) TaxID=690307 RepID=A0A1L9WFP8_ASPA1|nr:uncharacterized protein ASPACDRAFT_48450 [Aspergillus aculeatus ATCC 16872]OJJ95002.1 hypothetical protein ASPACDRAFT_48450 [Aspergillus aculeatus ATCC 16872]
MPVGEDTGSGNAGSYVAASWALSTIAGLTLLARYSIKSWIRWAIPKVSSPERLWGIEDLFYLLSSSFDLTQMIFFDAGLGRPESTLTQPQIGDTLRYAYISQLFEVIAAMLARLGIMYFLLRCFRGADMRLRVAIIICMGVQIMVNLATDLQVLLMCGSRTSHTAYRLAYFHYMWDPLPPDGSVVCQQPVTQVVTGLIQGGRSQPTSFALRLLTPQLGLNTTIDFFLAILAGVQLWRFPLARKDRSQSFISRFKKLPREARIRRLRQTAAISGPLLLSGIASLVKTTLLHTMNSVDDMAHSIVLFILLAKVENACLLIAPCAPVFRLLFSLASKTGAQNLGYPWYGNQSGARGQALELETVPHTQVKGTVVMSTVGKDTQPEQPPASEAVIIRTDIMVEYASERTA